MNIFTSIFMYCIYSEHACCKKKSHCSFSLNITLSAVSMHPQTSLKYLNLIYLFIPYSSSFLPSTSAQTCCPFENDT